MDENQQKALEYLEEGKNILIFGEAGSGKSTFINHIKSMDSKNCEVLAFTGMAAKNIDGSTINSFFSFPFKYIKPQFIRPFVGAQKRKQFDEIDIIIIDEISMVRVDMFEAIDRTLRINRNPTQPFGGVQMVLLGDPYQLPPVVENTHRNFFDNMHGTEFFFSSRAFYKGNFQFITFDKIYRQIDKNFKKLLGKIRVGEIDQEELDSFNRKHLNIKLDEEKKTILTPYRATADNINRIKLNSIKAEQKIFYMEKHGKTKGMIGIDIYDEELRLKKGAYVMLTKNKSKNLVNGSKGFIKEFKEEEIIIDFDGVGDVSILRETIEHKKPLYDKKRGVWTKEVIGWIKQYPIKLAYAITIHKAQGSTLNYVEVNLDRGAFAEGQLYVALSRVRDPDRLKLTAPIKMKDIIINWKILNFMENWKYKRIIDKDTESVVYNLIDKYDNVLYIGETNDPFSRFIEHKSDKSFLRLNVVSEVFVKKIAKEKEREYLKYFYNKAGRLPKYNKTLRG